MPAPPNASHSSSAPQTRWNGLLRGVAMASLDVGCDLHLHHLVGVGDLTAGDPGGAFFSLSTTSMPDTTSPITVYWPFRLEPSANMMKNCEFALSTLSPRARHADDAALERHVGEFLLQVRIFRTAGAVEVLAVAGLRHEAVHHAVERHVVVIALARELLDALGVLGREVGCAA